MARILNQLNKHLINQALHQPDCSSITDAELMNTVVATWPLEHGVARIPFSLSTLPFRSHFYSAREYTQFIDCHITDTFYEVVMTNLRFLHQQITLSSGGRIVFEENHQVNPFSSGLYYHVCAPIGTFNAVYDSGAAFEISNIGVDGYLRQAFVFLPNNPEYWNGDNSFGMYAGAHELGHALGITHFHEHPSIQAKLTQIRDGLYCSMMPYSDKIYSSINECKEDCHYPYAVYPGSLDARTARLAYANVGVSNTALFNDFEALIETMAYSFAITFFHQATAEFLENVKNFRGQPIFSPKKAVLIADTCVLSGIIALNFPVWIATTFALTASTKYLPEQLLRKLPNSAQTLLTSNYSIQLLNLSLLSLRMPLNTMMAMYQLNGIVVTTCIGKISFIGYMAASITNKITSICAKKVSAASPKKEKLDHIVVEDVPVDEPKTQKISFCMRLMGLFRCGRHNKSAEKHYPASPSFHV